MSAPSSLPAAPGSAGRSLESFEAEWQGIRLAITYEANWLNMARHGMPVAHLTVTSIAAERAPLPITGTGFRSHFPSAELVEQEAAPPPSRSPGSTTSSRSRRSRTMKRGIEGRPSRARSD